MLFFCKTVVQGYQIQYSHVSNQKYTYSNYLSFAQLNVVWIYVNVQFNFH